MIRVYLDWNVISSLKKPEFKELKEFIDKHKKYLQFPYSPAHFIDLMKSHSPDNEYFQMDLDTLNYLSDKHLIRWGKEGIEPLFGTPNEYFEGEVCLSHPWRHRHRRWLGLFFIQNHHFAGVERYPRPL